LLKLFNANNVVCINILTLNTFGKFVLQPIYTTYLSRSVMSTKDPLEKVVRYIFKEIDQSTLSFFLSGVYERSYKKNQIVINTKKVHDEIIFISKGLIKGYHTDDTGKEINIRFNKEGEFVTHYKSFLLQKPSEFEFKAIEASEVLVFNFKHINDCYIQYPSLEKFGRLIAENIVIKLDSRLNANQFYDAKTRYYDFMKDYNDLHNRLTLDDIASYLRMTRPSLSRIRGKKKNVT